LLLLEKRFFNQELADCHLLLLLRRNLWHLLGSSGTTASQRRVGRHVVYVHAGAAGTATGEDVRRLVKSDGTTLLVQLGHLAESMRALLREHEWVHAFIELRHREGLRVGLTRQRLA